MYEGLRIDFRPHCSVTQSDQRVTCTAGGLWPHTTTHLRHKKEHFYGVTLTNAKSPINCNSWRRCLHHSLALTFSRSRSAPPTHNGKGLSAADGDLRSCTWSNGTKLSALC